MPLTLAHKILEDALMSAMFICSAAYVNHNDQIAMPIIEHKYPSAEIVYDTKYQRDLMLSEGRIFVRAPEGGWNKIE